MDGWLCEYVGTCSYCINTLLFFFVWGVDGGVLRGCIFGLDRRTRGMDELDGRGRYSLN